MSWKYPWNILRLSFYPALNRGLQRVHMRHIQIHCHFTTYYTTYTIRRYVLSVRY